MGLSIDVAQQQCRGEGFARPRPEGSPDQARGRAVMTVRQPQSRGTKRRAVIRLPDLTMESLVRSGSPDNGPVVGVFRYDSPLASQNERDGWALFLLTPAGGATGAGTPKSQTRDVRI